MEFILNSRSKKVEIFYESLEEQQAILNLISKHLTYKEDNTPREVYINSPGISWTNAVSAVPYTISTTDSLSGITVLDNYSDSTISVSKLDDNSNEDGYSCLTASVPHKTK